MSGLVYELSKRNITEPLELKNPDLILGGVDWGFTNPAALTVVKYVDGVFYVVDEWYETGKTTQEIIDKMIAFTDKYKVRRWYADSANPEKILESQTKTGLNVVPYDKAKDAISAGIGYIYALIREGRFMVFNTLKNTLAEFETYHYPEVEDGKIVKDMPEPTNNHIMDAIRYAIHGYSPALRTSLKVRQMSPLDVMLAAKAPKTEGSAEMDFR
jgi:phage terminase large subunit